MKIIRRVGKRRAKVRHSVVCAARWLSTLQEMYKLFWSPGLIDTDVMQGNEPPFITLKLCYNNPKSVDYYFGIQTWSH